MKNEKNSLVLILIGVIIVILVVVCTLFATGTIILNINDTVAKSENENLNNAADDNSHSNIETDNNNNNNNNEKTVLYLYTSADRHAMEGNPATLELYSMNNSMLEFKYHIVWNQNDILGIASKTSENTYIYEKDNYKIEFIFSDDSVKIIEYLNGQLSAEINLFK